MGMKAFAVLVTMSLLFVGFYGYANIQGDGACITDADCNGSVCAPLGDFLIDAGRELICVQCVVNSDCPADYSCDENTNTCVYNGPICGNGVCDNDEDSATCREDCPLQT